VHRFSRRCLRIYYAGCLQRILASRHKTRRPTQVSLRMSFWSVPVRPDAFRPDERTGNFPASARHDIVAIQVENLSRLLRRRDCLLQFSGGSHTSCRRSSNGSQKSRSNAEDEEVHLLQRFRGLSWPRHQTRSSRNRPYQHRVTPRRETTNHSNGTAFVLGAVQRLSTIY